MKSFLKTQLLGGLIVITVWILAAQSAVNHIGDMGLVVFTYIFSQIGLSLLRSGEAKENYAVSVAGHIMAVFWMILFGFLVFLPTWEITRIFDHDMSRTSAFMAGMTASMSITLIQLILIHKEAVQADSVK